MLDLDPTGVIVATGSAPRREILGNLARGILNTPGLDRGDVHDVWDVLEHEVRLGEKVVVDDDGEGSWKAIGIALQLREGAARSTW